MKVPCSRCGEDVSALVEEHAARVMGARTSKAKAAAAAVNAKLGGWPKGRERRKEWAEDCAWIGKLKKGDAVMLCGGRRGTFRQQRTVDRVTPTGIVVIGRMRFAPPRGRWSTSGMNFPTSYWLEQVGRTP